MIFIKTQEQINLLRVSNRLVAMTLGELSNYIAPGVTPLKLDRIAYEFIKDKGAEPAFLNYKGFPNSICVSVNDVAVHGVPTAKPLEDGDIVTIDCGVRQNGFCGDSAFTFAVGSISEKNQEFVTAVRSALDAAVNAVCEGVRLGTVGHLIQEKIERAGYSVIRELTGHGIGRELHEDPLIYNYGIEGSGTRLEAGMVIAIEPIASAGERHVRVSKDGFGIETCDGSCTAHFEQTIVVEKNGANVLSVFDFLK